MTGAVWIFAVSLVGVCSAQISVEAEYEIVTLPNNGNQLNTYASLVCLITPPQANILVRWITPDEISVDHSTSKYSLSTGSLRSVGGGSDYGSILIIWDISYQDAGLYWCEVMDTANCSEFPKFASVELVMQMTLEAVVNTVSVEISSDREPPQVELKCEVTGYIRPDSDFLWFKEDTEIITSEKYQTSFKDGHPNTTQVGENELSPRRLVILIIHNVSATDIGKYSCRSRETGGKASIHLDIKNEPKPSIISSPPEIIEPTKMSHYLVSSSSLHPSNIIMASNHSSSENCVTDLIVAIVCTFVLTAIVAVFVTLLIVYLWFRKKQGKEANITSPNVNMFPMSLESTVDKRLVDIYQISTGDEIEESNGNMKPGSINPSN